MKQTDVAQKQQHDREDWQKARVNRERDRLRGRAALPVRYARLVLW
jgi:hypothetical protein